jgi:hypothetical protein
VLVFLSELLFEFPELHLILPQQRPLIDILINTRLILDLLGSRGKLQSGDGLAEALGRGRYHGHHGRLAVASQ